VLYYTWGVAAFSLTTTNATELWKINKAMPGDVSSPVIYKDHIYICGGCEMTVKGMWCVSLATGEIKWAHPVENAGSSSPILVDGKVIGFVDRNAKDDPAARIVMFKATPEKYEELGAITKAGDKPWFCELSSPAVANGRLFVRQLDAVACYDLTGK